MSVKTKGGDFNTSNIVTIPYGKPQDCMQKHAKYEAKHHMVSHWLLVSLGFWCFRHVVTCALNTGCVQAHPRSHAWIPLTT